MKSVHVFPGQGSQRKGMGAGLFEKFPDLVAEADACLGYSIEELCLRDPDRVLHRTEYTQPALYVVNVLHHLDRVATEGEPAAVAGHSLGEYCALFAAGAFDFATGLRLVAKRGELMSRAPKGAMAAVLKLDQERVREVLADLPYRNIDLANINSGTQCVLSGVHDELLAPEVRAAYTEAGAVFVPLNVSAAFHSRCMRDVEEEFAEFLAGFDFGRLRIPVVANCTARLYPDTDYRDLLVRQISSPVRWYESVSWLIGQGHRDFHEVGPGNVLTKLTTAILDEPLTTQDPDPRPVTGTTGPRTELVFMYAGQGSQYHRMGRELYDTHPAFRNALDRCSSVYESAHGTSLVDVIHDDTRKGREFDDILGSHAALFSIGYSLTQTLLDEGLSPDAVLGHSMGEYIAATVAGAMSFEDGLDLVMRQARLLHRTRPGGMLSVLASPALFEERRELFHGVTLAGVNFASNFVVSGEAVRLAEVRAALDEEGVIAVLLPVRQAFHSAFLDEIRAGCLDLGRTVTVRTPRLPVYSSSYAGQLGVDARARWEHYLWDVIRERVRFDELMTTAFDTPDKYFFVDLSATGSLANFLKHGHGGTFRAASVINQFGNNSASLKALLNRLDECLGGAGTGAEH